MDVPFNTIQYNWDGFDNTLGYPTYMNPSCIRMDHGSEASSKSNDINKNLQYINETSSHVIHDQGSCGACWAFVATGCIETSLEISLHNQNQFVNSQPQSPSKPKPKLHGYSKVRHHYKISSQELLDCDRWNNMGCSGGNPIDAFQYVLENGIGMEGYEPYQGMPDKCDRKYYESSHPRVFISNFIRITPMNGNLITRYLLRNGPVAIGICGTDSNFINYRKGIFGMHESVGVDGHSNLFCCTEQNHAMLLVGHGSVSQVPVETEQDRDRATDEVRVTTHFWIFRNSWGPQWGENGYMRLYRMNTTTAPRITSYSNSSQSLSEYMDYVENNLSDYGVGSCGMYINPSIAVGAFVTQKPSQHLQTAKNTQAEICKDELLLSIDRLQTHVGWTGGIGDKMILPFVVCTVIFLGCILYRVFQIICKVHVLEHSLAKQHQEALVVRADTASQRYSRAKLIEMGLEMEPLIQPAAEARLPYGSV